MNSQSDFTNSGSGLLRFRSAPSSLFANFTISGDDSVDVVTPANPHNLGSQMLVDDLEETKPLANLPPPYPRQNSSAATLFSAMDVDSSGGSSNLMRQNSSPAGLFSHLSIQNGYGTLKDIGNDINGDLSPSSSRLRGPMNFSSGLPSSLGMLSQISEIENEGVGGNCLGYPLGSWNDDSSHFPENFPPLKRDHLNGDAKLIGISNPSGDFEIRTNLLSRHLSLPKTSTEMTSMEKLLEFQDSIPCKARAKRGCATHPRSIAERVRRTRISERMRKLQELVPNMDKQTSTADMLDLAVDYIKQLQRQYKTLNANRANCKCSSVQKSFRNL